MYEAFPRFLSETRKSSSTPFAIVPWEGEPTGGYMVKDGYCFSTFSYQTGTFIPIENLNTRFEVEEDQKFYIDFTVTPNLQIEKAEIKCTKTGPDAQVKDKSNPEQWSSYPNMFYIQPEDQTDEDGRVTTIAEGKKQIKCYVLIGYRQDDKTKNGAGSPPPSGSYEDNPDFIQMLNSNIILLASMLSGVPAVFPFPYLDARTHVKAIKSESIL